MEEHSQCQDLGGKVLGKRELVQIDQINGFHDSVHVGIRHGKKKTQIFIEDLLCVRHSRWC